MLQPIGNAGIPTIGTAINYCSKEKNFVSRDILMCAR